MMMTRIAIPFLAALIPAVLGNHAGAADLAVPSKQFPTVQSAVDAAVDGDRVIVAAGVYTERVDLLQKSIEIIGAGPALTRFVGKSQGFSTFTAQGPSSQSVVLRALSVEGAAHGAVTSTVTTLIAGCSFTGCRRPTSGGAVRFSAQPGATLTVTDSIFAANSAVFSGGAIGAEYGHATVERCHFAGNIAAVSTVSPCRAGSIIAWQTSLVVRDCTFTGERARANVTLGPASGDGGGLSIEAHGGAIWADSPHPAHSVVIENSTFRDCKAESRIDILNSGKAVWQAGAVGRGGAVSVVGSISGVFRNLVLEDCSAIGSGSGSPDGQSYVNSYADGGGMFLYTQGAHALEDVVVRRCEASAQHLSGAGADIHTSGGGITMLRGSLTSVTIEDCKTSSGTGWGGGLHANVYDYFGLNSQLVATDLTIRRCTGRDGGGAWIRGTSVITRGVFEDNIASNGVGGGVAGRAGDRTFVDSTFRRNEARGLGVGAYGGGLLTDGGEMLLERCVFEQNLSHSNIGPAGAGADGGAILANMGSQSRVVDCTIADNLALATSLGSPGSTARAGGLLSYGPIELARTNLIRNTARVVSASGINSYAEGAAIRMLSGSSLALDGCRVEANLAYCECATGSRSYGGAIRCSGMITANDCVFASNKARCVIPRTEYSEATGGAILGDWGMSLLRCSFTANEADGGSGAEGAGTGGAIRTNTAGAPAFSVVDCDFTDNKASGRGGVLDHYLSFNQPVTGGFVNCMFAGNTAPRANCIASTAPAGLLPLVNCSGCGHGPNPLAFENTIDGGGNDLRPACVDCDGNGIEDAIDIASGAASDCNSNGVPDSCDIASGTAIDSNTNGKIDRCELDLNHDGVVGGADLALLLSAFGVANGSQADFNGDGLVSGSDLAFLLANWGA